MKIGRRIIFNKATGKVLNGTFDEKFDSGLTQEMIDELRPIEIDFIDLPYGDVTLEDVDNYHIDIKTRAIVIDSKITHIPTYSELQQQLLQAQGVI